MLNNDANVAGMALLRSLFYRLWLIAGCTLPFTGEPRDAFATVVTEAECLFLGERDKNRSGLR